MVTELFNSVSCLTMDTWEIPSVNNKKKCGQEVARLGPTMYMGEAALAGLDSCKVTVRATTTVDLLMLQRSDAVRVLGPEFLQLVSQTNTTTKKQVFILPPIVFLDEQFIYRWSPSIAVSRQLKCTLLFTRFFFR